MCKSALKYKPNGNVNSVEWNDGMERWSGLLDHGVEYWTGLLECHAHNIVVNARAHVHNCLQCHSIIHVHSSVASSSDFQPPILYAFKN